MKSTLDHPVSTRPAPGAGQIRALRPGDEAALQEFFYSHTPDTIYERYGCLVATMSAERASELVNVDQASDCALGVFARDGQTLQAVGRYCLDKEGDAAELAFVVHETRRRRGLATSLLQLLIAIAKARGLHRLWAQVNAHNADMLGIFRRHRFNLQLDPGTGVVLATLPLPRTSSTPFSHD